MWTIIGVALTATVVAAVAICLWQRSAREKTQAKHAGGWRTYRNDTHFYEIDVPQGWNTVEASRTEGAATRARQQHEILVEDELQKVTLFEQNYTMWQGQFQIRVLANRGSLTLEEWARNYRKESATGADLIQGVSDMTLDRKAAKRFSIFGFDHEAIEVVTMDKGNAYVLSFAGENPNDPDVERHRRTYERMLSTFRVRESE